MSITNKIILLISPANTIGGKASFTKNLIDVFKQNGVKFYHIDLIRTRSNNIYAKFLEHLYSFFIYKIKLIKVLITKPIDIVQIHSSSYFDFYDLSLFIIGSKLFKKKVVLRYGGASFPSFYQTSYYLNKKYLKWILLSLDKLIVQSQYWNDFFEGLGVKRETLIILPNFVDEKQFSPQQKDYQSPELQVLFMPATDLKRKGFFDIKNVIVRLAKQYPNVIFHIVGPKVEKYIKGENILTYDKIYGNKKTYLFNQCQVYLLATHREGFPNSLIEAMAAGMAVITTNIPEIRCLVNDNHDCLLIDPGSEMQFKEKFLFLLNNRNKLQEIGKNAKELVKTDYSLNLMSGYLKELYL